MIELRAKACTANNGSSTLGEGSIRYDRMSNI
jgi:hypothetical protein